MLAILTPSVTDFQHWRIKSSGVSQSKISKLKVDLFLGRMYKLKKERNFGNLLGVGKQIGCTDVHSGIGDVKYVKDVLTQAVVTTKFTCSKFGPHSSVYLGWVNTMIYFNNRKTACIKIPSFDLTT